MTQKRHTSRFLDPDYRPPQGKGPRGARLPSASRFLDPGYQPPPDSPFDYQLDDPVYILGLIQQSELLIQQLQLHLDELHRRRREQASGRPSPQQQQQ